MNVFAASRRCDVPQLL